MTSDLKFYWKLFIKRLPILTALFLLCTGFGVALAIKLPTIYSSTAILLVESPQITDIGATGRVGAGEQLDIIQQRLMTRANLIDIANNRDVFGERLAPDQAIAKMRKATNIRRGGGRGRAITMTVTFEARSGPIAAAVVGDLIALILTENVNINVGLAERNLDFFEQEVDRLGTELTLQSEKILQFKNANSDALPDSMNFRLNRQITLQERISRDEREIASLTDQRARVVAIYQATGRLQASPEVQLTPEERKLEELQSRLSAMTLTLSETNPRVKVVASQIAQLEATVAAQKSTGDTPSGPDQASLLEVTLAQIDSQIETLRDTIAKNSQELDDLNTSITRTTPNQIALEALNRDYSNIRIQYNEAVDRQNNARMTERVELGGKGRKITVIEQAIVPNRPSSPNRPLVAAAGIVAGLALAGTLFLLMELTNSSIRRSKEITKALGITPLATIPYMESVRRKWMRRAFQIASFIFVLVGVPAGLWAVDQYYLPLDLLVERVMARVGLA